tara:strand:+ start:24 stop:737 length:714 start_codon:yes stop_codon:yes gene_type:complete
MLDFHSSTRKTVSTISVDDVSVIVTKKRIRHCYIKVNRESGNVCVSVPIGWNAEAVEELVRSKARWIKSKRASVSNRVLNRKLDLNDGELHKVWGSEVPLVNTSNSGRHGVKCSKGTLVINAPAESSLDTKEKLLAAWYAREVKIAALPLVDKWESVLRVKAGRLSIQKMKSKWGSCNLQNGNIRLNADLAKFPKGALEHVIVHELVHLIEPSHSKRFYALMDEFLPNWKVLKALTR